METKHTPTPWHLSPDKIDDTECIVKATTQAVCNTLHGNDEANAAFICLSCNLHDELVKALKQIADEPLGLVRDKEIARAALAMAEKGE